MVNKLNEGFTNLSKNIKTHIVVDRFLVLLLAIWGSLWVLFFSVALGSPGYVCTEKSAVSEVVYISKEKTKVLLENGLEVIFDNDDTKGVHVYHHPEVCLKSDVYVRHSWDDEPILKEKGASHYYFIK